MKELGGGGKVEGGGWGQTYRKVQLDPAVPKQFIEAAPVAGDDIHNLEMHR